MEKKGDLFSPLPLYICCSCFFTSSLNLVRCFISPALRVEPPLLCSQFYFTPITPPHKSPSPSGILALCITLHLHIFHMKYSDAHLYSQHSTVLHCCQQNAQSFFMHSVTTKKSKHPPHKKKEKKESPDREMYRLHWQGVGEVVALQKQRLTKYRNV